MCQYLLMFFPEFLFHRTLSYTKGSQSHPVDIICHGGRERKNYLHEPLKNMGQVCENRSARNPAMAPDIYCDRFTGSWLDEQQSCWNCSWTYFSLSKLFLLFFTQFLTFTCPLGSLDKSFSAWSLLSCCSFHQFVIHYLCYVTGHLNLRIFVSDDGLDAWKLSDKHLTNEECMN